MDEAVSLSGDDIALLVEALDAYEYWELGRDLPRNNGLVFIPGDAIEKPDRYWPTAPTPEEAEAIDLIRRCRALAARLA